MSDIPSPLQVTASTETGQIASVKLYGQELLDVARPCESELWVNGAPLKLRPHVDPNQPDVAPHLKGERYTDHFSGWGLVLSRVMGERKGLKHPCFGIQSLVRRELCDFTVPCPGPGGPVVEAPLFLDTMTLLGWNWNFWGEDTRMIFPSSHSSGPEDEWGHSGYENDAPEEAKKWLKNVWRRIYPGCMVIHGGLFYNAKTGHWLAITCRRPNVGYILNIENAGRGIGYDFTFHSEFQLGESVRMPEIRFYYGADEASMNSWLGDYVTHYMEETPDWVHKTLWSGGLAWTNLPTWSEQGDAWVAEAASGTFSGIKYSLVTDRPVDSGTTPYSYTPDALHGTLEEFKQMGLQLKEKGIPWLVWMSHSGLCPGNEEIDEDWFIRGVDGRTCASWGNIDSPGLTHINPGHPGYIEYTKKWMRFYIQECGAKGIFFDCLSWAFPPDYTPRPWMRRPGDTNLQAVRFMDEISAYLKELDPEAILLGEGSASDFPAHIFSVSTNPKRALDGLGPRDWLLQLNRFAPKKLVIDQGPNFAPASGMTMMLSGPSVEAKNRYLAQLLKEKGGRGVWTPLPGDLSLLESDKLLVVPLLKESKTYPAIALPSPWDSVKALTEVTDGSHIALQNGRFVDVPPGIYKLE